MNINERYEALCMELGHLTLELQAREARRDAIVEEMQVLRRLAASLRGGQHVSMDAKPDAPFASATSGANGHAATSATIEAQ